MMADNTNLILTAEAWAEIVVEKWKDRIDKMGVGSGNSDSELYSSFEHEVIANSNGNLQRIDFAFNYYGKFIDMGVRKGVTLNDADQLNPKPWYSVVWYSQYKRLVEILSQKYARIGVLSIVENIRDNSIKSK